MRGQQLVLKKGMRITRPAPLHLALFAFPVWTNHVAGEHARPRPRIAPTAPSWPRVPPVGPTAKWPSTLGGAVSLTLAMNKTALNGKNLEEQDDGSWLRASKSWLRRGCFSLLHRCLRSYGHERPRRRRKPSVEGRAGSWEASGVRRCYSALQHLCTPSRRRPVVCLQVRLAA